MHVTPFSAATILVVDQKVSPLFSLGSGPTGFEASFKRCCSPVEGSPRIESPHPAKLFCRRFTSNRSHRRADDGSPSGVLSEKREHIVLPDGHAAVEKIVSVFRASTDRRIDPQAVRLAELTQASVQCRARRRGVVVGGVDEEDRSRQKRHRRKKACP